MSDMKSKLELPKEPKFYNYESPIEKIVQQIADEVRQKEEETLMITVSEKVGFKVDKDELIKALQYDRKQYEKGLADGYKQGIETVEKIVKLYICDCVDDFTERSIGNFEAINYILSEIKKLLGEE